MLNVNKGLKMVDPEAVEHLQESREALIHSMQAIRDGCKAAHRDLTDVEVETLSASKDRVAAIDKYLHSSRGRQTGVDCSMPLGKSLGTHKAGGAFLEEVGGSAAGEYESILELCQGVYQNARYGKMDRRLDTAYATAQSIGIGSEGGFAVPTAMLQRFVTTYDPATPVLSAVDTIMMPTDTASIPLWHDESHATTAPYGISFSVTAENAEITPSQSLTARAVTLSCSKHTAMFRASNEFMQDSAPWMRTRMDTIFAEAMRFEMEKQIIAGSGAGGNATGILNAGDSLIEASKEVGQAAATLVFRNIAEMRARMIPALKPTSMWLMNPTACKELPFMTIVDGTAGSPVYQPTGGASDLPFETLYGRPVVESEHCQTLGTAGDVVLFHPKTYVFGVREGATVDLDTSTRFEYDQIAFRLKFRSDGASLMSGALTPANGDTQSWAVSLETRS